MLLWQQSFRIMSAILAAFLFVSKKLFCEKLQKILMKLVENVFAASNWNIIKNKVQKKKKEQILSKSYSFLFKTLICIINIA